jgi:hypothetical protein
MSIPAAGGSPNFNRLTLGATDLAPGDFMGRAVDLNIGATTSAGIIDHVTLTVSASPSSALNTDSTIGLRIWIQKCSQEWGE